MRKRALKDKDKAKTKEEIIKELAKLRRRIAALEKSESKLKKTEEALQENERIFSTLISNLPGMAYRCANDKDWTMEYVSEGCTPLTGYKPDDLVKNATISYGQLIHSEDSGRVWEEVQDALQQSRPFQLEYRIITRQGTTKWVWERGRGILSDQGELCALEGFITDITQLKQAEETLRESEERFRTIIESTTDAIVTADREGKISFWNSGAKNIFGYEKEEILGKPVHILLPQHERETDKKGLEEFLATGTSPFVGRTVESTCLKKDGSEFFGGISRFRWKAEGKNFIGAIIRDITEHKQAEEKLLRQHTVLEAINEIFQESLTSETSEEVASACLALVQKLTKSPFGFIGEINQNGRFDTISLSNPGWNACKIEGSEAAKMIRDMEIRGIWGRVIKDGQSQIVNDPASHPDRVGTPEGHPLITRFMGVPLKLAGKTIGMIALANKEEDYNTADLEAVEALSLPFFEALNRMQTEEALRESEERFRSVMENANDAIFLVDRGGTIRFFNRKAEELYGYKADEVLGKPHSVLVPKHLQEIHQKWMEKYLSLDESAISGKIVEGVGERKDGSEFYAETSTAILRRRDEIFLVAFLRDITERKKAEEERGKLEAQLRQSQKMEAVGHLAGGIAHDFNNILTTIIGYASLIQMKLQENDPVRAQIEHILSSANRAATLTQNLLAFSRKQIINPRPVKINGIIQKAEKLLSRLIGEDIELRTMLSEEDPSTLADPVQMEQILMNLATNARDAMPQGGHLIISTQRVVIDDEYIKVHGYGKKGAYVLISIEDTGIGMDKATQEKVFDPFFTTKEVGKGTGLGLSMAYGIVKQHNGYINFYSEPGKGTTLKIYLPAIEINAEDTVSTYEVDVTPERGSETILVAEDDPDVRKLTRDVLEQFGYTVIEALDGEEAVRIFRENRDRIQFLLLDVIMPKKNGREAYEEIRKINPEMKALFISGYTANIIQKRGLLEEGLDFILKPISPNDLLRKLREVIDKQ